MQKSKTQRTKSLLLVLTIVLVSTTSFLPSSGEARRRSHKRFVIHVPFKIKTHHHTHTVYSQIHSGGTKQTMYKILGYSLHGHHGAGQGHGHGNGHGHGHGGGHHGYGHMEHGGNVGYGKGEGYDHHGGGGYGSEKAHGELSYDDMHSGCCDGNAHGDMIFNHFSRNDAEFPVELEEEFIDEEQQGDDEWE